MNRLDLEEKSTARLLPAGRDLRTRYNPRARIRPFYLQAAPWLDLLFILFFLVLVQSRLVLRPGVVVALPAYGGAGVQGGSIAVLVPNRQRQAARSAPTLYFADEAYRLDDAVRMQALVDVLANEREVDQTGTLTLYADQRVSQVYVMQVMDLAATAGFERINIGTAPPTLPMP